MKNSSPTRVFQISIHLILLAAVLGACTLPRLPGIPGPTQAPSAAPTRAIPKTIQQTLPPALVETSPAPRSELPLNGSLVFQFNQPMDKNSVEASLKIEPALGGMFTWTNDTTLTFTPDQAFQPATDLQVSLDTGAKATNGLSLQEPTQLQYRTVGPLQVTQRLPEPDTQEVDPSSAVVAAFNRPVVALGEDPAELPAAFQLDTAVSGRGEWVNTSTYIYYPEPALAGGKEYTVQLNQDLKGTDGSSLDEAILTSAGAGAWSFSTALPKLVSIEPVTESPVPLDAKFTLTFNQPMDRGSVEAGFSLTDAVNNSVSGKFSWDEPSTQLSFQPDQLLARGSAYTLNLSGQSQAQGGTPLGDDFTVSLISVPNLSVVSTEPAAGQPLQAYGSYGNLILQFSAPLQTSPVDGLISFSPAITGMSTFVDNETQRLMVSGFFQPSSTYTLSIAAELADKWGQPLGQPFALTFQTAPALPTLTLVAEQTGFGVVFLRPQDAGMPAQATNLANLTLSQGSLNWDEFLRLTGSNGFEARQTFQPANAQTWSQAVTLPPNQSQVIQIGLNPQNAPLTPGLYFISIQSPELQAQSQAARAAVIAVVSRTQLTFKLGGTRALVWAVNLDGGTPAANQPVALYSEDGNSLAQGTTDARGLFETEVASREDPFRQVYAVLGQPGDPGFGIAVSTWAQGVQGWDFGIPMDFRGPRLQTYLYTDRPIYRPGQTLYFRGVARQANNGRYSQPDLFHLPLNLYGSTGAIGPALLATFDLSLSSFGTFNGSYTLSEDAQPGLYRLSFPDLPESDLYFQVADYRKPEIDLQVSLNPAEAKLGDPLEAALSANYFFGAPAGNLPVSWILFRNQDFFTLPGAEVGTLSTDWFTSIFPVGGLGQAVIQGEGRTAPDGSLSITIPTTPGPEEIISGSPQRYILEATLQDESGFPVSARASVLVHPGTYYAGITPDAWTGEAGSPMGFTIQTVTWTKQPVEVQNLQALFQKVTWKEEEQSTFGFPTLTPQYTPVGSVDFSTDSSGGARLEFTPPEPGTYQLEVGGGGAKTQFLLWVGGPGAVEWPNLPNQKIHLTADQEEYQSGERADIFIPNPFGEPVQALVTLERGDVMRAEIIQVEANGSNFEAELGPEAAPNIFVSATLLGSQPDGKPDFRQGYLEIRVDPAALELNLEVASSPERAQPGGEVSFAIRVTDSEGQPVQGEFSLAVVDLAALALAEPNSRNIVDAFYAPQPLGVQTGLTLAVYAGRNLLIAGGQGGGGDGMPEFQFIREDFRDTAYWNAEITTDENGQAQVSLQLPDNLTTWQADIRGLTADTLVGQATAQIQVGKDLLIRPEVPRFLVAGDHVELAAIVQNNTQGALDVNVTLQAGGVGLDDASLANQQIQVQAGDRTRVTWWATTGDAEQAELVFSAQSGALEDTSRPESGSIPILHYSAPQTFATAGVLDQGGERLEVVSLPGSYQPTGGELRLNLQPSLAAAVLDNLEIQDQPVYDHPEAVLSGFLPALEIFQTLEKLGLDAPELKEAANQKVSESLARLGSLQNPDGGWGWSRNSDSQVMLTAYALVGYTRAGEAGFGIDPQVLAQAQEFLRASQAAPGMTSADWQFDQLAFSLYALQQSGSGDLAGTAGLFDERARLAPWSQALLALTLEGLSPGDERARTLISDLESNAIRTATGMHWEARQTAWQTWSTPVQTTAVVVYAIAQRDPASPILPDAVRYLMAHRSANQVWGSTYETAWVLLALTLVLEGTGELQADFGYSAVLNGTEIANGQAGGAGALSGLTTTIPLDQLLQDQPNGLLIQREEGAGRLYYTAGLAIGRPVETAPPLQQGVHVERSYFLGGQNCRAATCEPVRQVALGETTQSVPISVHVTVTLPQDTYYLAVEDWIPAGSEVLNTELKTSQQGLEDGSQNQVDFDPRDPNQEGWGWWYFSAPRIFSDHIAWTAEYLPAGTYTLTYTLIPFQTGEFRVLPARAWEYYFPEVQGTSRGELFTISK